MRKIACAATLMLGLASAPALADCKPSDLRGTWHGFLSGSFRSDLEPFYMGCNAIINSSGRFRNGSRCDDAGSVHDRLRTHSIDLRANLTVHENCTVQGELTFRFDGSLNLDCPLNAVVTQNHEMMVGVAVCRETRTGPHRPFDDILMVNMVRG